MSRLIAFAALAALIAGCSDAPVAPRSLHPTGPSFDEGTPPPPPVSGRGDGTFDASEGGSEEALAVILQNCSVSAVTQYDFVYTTDQSMDPVGIHQVAHIKFDEDLLSGEDLSHQIVIRQKPHEPAVVDANGMIVGPDFSFRITSSTGGFLTPSAFQIFVTGVLKTADGSCEASGQFDGTLTPAPVPEP
jgi:hypothetical protein